MRPQPKNPPGAAARPEPKPRQTKTQLSPRWAREVLVEPSDIQDNEGLWGIFLPNTETLGRGECWKLGRSGGAPGCVWEPHVVLGSPRLCLGAPGCAWDPQGVFGSPNPPPKSALRLLHPESNQPLLPTPTFLSSGEVLEPLSVFHCWDPALGCFQCVFLLSLPDLTPH